MQAEGNISPSVVVSQVRQHESYAKNAREKLREIEREAMSDMDDGPELQQLKAAIKAAREAYATRLINSTAAGANGCEIAEARDTIADSRGAVRDLLKRASEAGINPNALKWAMRLQKLDPEERAAFWDSVDQLCVALRLWTGEGE